jgi:hypothetical protein
MTFTGLSCLVPEQQRRASFRAPDAKPRTTRHIARRENPAALEPVYQFFRGLIQAGIQQNGAVGGAR